MRRISNFIFHYRKNVSNLWQQPLFKDRKLHVCFSSGAFIRHLRNFFSVRCSVELFNFFSRSSVSFSKLSFQSKSFRDIRSEEEISLAKSFHWNVSSFPRISFSLAKVFCICQWLLKICLLLLQYVRFFRPKRSWITFWDLCYFELSDKCLSIFYNSDWSWDKKRRQNGEHAQHEQQHVTARSEEISSGIFTIFANTVRESVSSAAAEHTRFQYESSSVQ